MRKHREGTKGLKSQARLACYAEGEFRRARKLLFRTRIAAALPKKIGKEHCEGIHGMHGEIGRKIHRIDYGFLEVEF